MSEDYTYEPLQFVSVAQGDLAYLLKVEEKVKRAYALYHQNAASLNHAFMSFDLWLGALAGEVPHIDWEHLPEHAGE